jgi:hypothetical protein
LAGGLTLLLVLDVAVVVRLRAPTRPPSFDRGGAFARVGTPGRPVPYSPRAGVDAVVVAPTTTTTTVARPAGSRARTAPAGPVLAAAPPFAPASSSTPPLPAVGTYTYAVTGWESATGFGQRDYPATMTLDVHTAPDLAADELVFDLVFSDQHEEREIIAFRPDGLAMTFEGGSVTFGPGTQTSEADYKPPMLQIPWPLTAGTTRSGTTDAGSRVEDWTVKVGGQENGLWVVDITRASRPGGSESVRRARRYWFDAARGLWTKWHETMHGERSQLGFTFTYDTEFDAVLSAGPVNSGQGR